MDGAAITLMFQVDEGRRLAVSGVQIEGNKTVSDEADRRRDEDAARRASSGGTRASSTRTSSPATSASRSRSCTRRTATSTCRSLKDTIIVDRAQRQGARSTSRCRKGPQYRIGSFEVNGAKRFSSEEIARFYPFGERSTTTVDRQREGRTRAGGGDDAEGRLRPVGVGRRHATTSATRTRNEGYIYASVAPGRRAPQSRARIRCPTVESPLGDRREDAGDHQPRRDPRQRLHDRDVHSRPDRSSCRATCSTRTRCIRSYQSIGNLGFFETPHARPRHAAGERPGRRRHHLPREGEAHRQRELRRVGRSGHRRRRLHRLRSAEPVRPVQARLAAVAVRPVHQRLQPDVQRSAHQAVARFRERSRPITRRRAIIIRDIGRQTRRGGQLQFGFPLPSSRFSRLFAVVRRREGELRRRRAGRARSNCNVLLPLDARPARSTTTRASACRSRRGRRPREHVARSSTAVRSAARRASSGSRRRCAHYAPLAQFGGRRSAPSRCTLVARAVGQGRRGVRRPGTVLHLAEVLAGRRAVRRAAARLRGVLDHAAAATSRNADQLHGAADVVRQRVLHERRRSWDSG